MRSLIIASVTALVLAGTANARPIHTDPKPSARAILPDPNQHKRFMMDAHRHCRDAHGRLEPSSKCRPH